MLYMHPQRCFFHSVFFLFITELLTVKRLQDGGKQDGGKQDGGKQASTF